MGLDEVLKHKDSENSVYGLYITKGDKHTKAGKCVGMIVGDKGRLKGFWEWVRKEYPGYKMGYYFENFVNYGIDAEGKECCFM